MPKKYKEGEFGGRGSKAAEIADREEEEENRCAIIDCENPRTERPALPYWCDEHAAHRIKSHSRSTDPGHEFRSEEDKAEIAAFEASVSTPTAAVTGMRS